jgi:hypothetical protein
MRNLSIIDDFNSSFEYFIEKFSLFLFVNIFQLKIAFFGMYAHRRKKHNRK